MITGAVLGALLVGGIAVTIFRNETTFLGFLLPVVGCAMAGAAVFGIVGLAVAADEPEPCPDGQVYVVPALNDAGARGCVPFELLPKIGGE
nr:MAG TPA: hypothetical protein [Caudoviricetes sp.]